MTTLLHVLAQLRSVWEKTVLTGRRAKHLTGRDEPVTNKRLGVSCTADASKSYARNRYEVLFGTDVGYAATRSGPLPLSRS
eukprot:2073724-Rhodomonas_salina.1